MEKNAEQIFFTLFFADDKVIVAGDDEDAHYASQIEKKIITSGDLL